MFTFIALVLAVIALVQVSNLRTKVRELEHKLGIGVTAQPSASQHAKAPVQAQPTPEVTHRPIQTERAPETRVRSVSSEETTGQWLGKIGIFAVFIGIVFLIKYGYDQGFIGDAGIVAIVTLAGVILIAIGRYLKTQYATFAQVLMGGGVGVLYLAVFAMVSVFHLVPVGVGFLAAIIVTALSVVLSLIDSARALAVIGTVGAFLTPFVLDFGSEQGYLMPLSYVLVVDIGILAIAIWKKWNALTVLSLIGTGIMYISLYAGIYRADDLGGFFFFLSAYFFVFLSAALAHHIIRQEKSEPIDLLCVVVNAFGYFGLAYTLLNPLYHSYMGGFAIILAILFAILAYVSRKTTPNENLLTLFLTGICAIFFTIAIPIQFSGVWIALAWLLESVVLFVVMMIEKNQRIQPFALTVFVLASIKILFSDAWTVAAHTPFINQSFGLIALLVIVAYAYAYAYKKHLSWLVKEEDARAASGTFFVFGNMLTVLTGTVEIGRFYSISATKTRTLQNQIELIVTAFWALYSIALITLGFLGRIKLARILGLILILMTAGKIFIQLWGYGEVYRIVTSIVFGIIALIGSFLYAKFRDRIRQML